ncbi:hypothetical protein V8E55_005678 [Tylopilus felleus]
MLGAITKATQNGTGATDALFRSTAPAQLHNFAQHDAGDAIATVVSMLISLVAKGHIRGNTRYGMLAFDYLYYVSQEYCTQLKLVGCGHHWRCRFIHHKPAQACIYKANILWQEGFTHMHRGVAVLEHQYIAVREVMGGGVCCAGDNRAVDRQANVLCPIQDSICVIKGRPGGTRIFLECVALNASTQHIPPRQITIEEFTLRQPVLELQDALVAGNHNELRLVVSAGEKDNLTETQLKISFELLLKQDDPSLYYEHWVRDCPTVPTSFQNYTGINLKSSEQWKTLLVPLFSRNHATVDFYLARVIFPKEAKEFPSKLACSGWDLAEKKECLVTGFSGTNDGRYLLPLHIIQRDPEHQHGTNAKILSYLLQPKNDHDMCMTHQNGERRTTNEFLSLLVAQEPEIRVLLDVGAQMLDLHNYELARAWLAISTDASAAIYFNEDDELTVLTRDGTTQLLLSSPFVQQLDQCVIYLDDAHTRGTDIKFPSGFCAAMTLGPKVTKDRLAQASKGPLNQGMDHQARYNAWSKFCADELTPKQLSTKWLQPKAKSLVELYAPHDSSKLIALTVPEIHEHCVNLGITSLREGGMDEEQEREVIHEVVREQEEERPPRVSPAKHSLSNEVVDFVKTGAISNKSSVFRPVFTTLSNTSAITNEPHVWSRWVLTTEDFCRTIVPTEGDESSKMDDFLRPVQWIVSSQMAVRQVLVIFSPHEVEKLLPYICKSEHVHLHIYTLRTTKSMKPSDDLRLYSIPAVSADWTLPRGLMSQLNCLYGSAGSFVCTLKTCKMKKIWSSNAMGSSYLNNVLAASWEKLDVLLGLRRKGMVFAQTHMGRVLDGRLLVERDFEHAEAELDMDVE